MSKNNKHKYNKPNPPQEYKPVVTSPPARPETTVSGSKDAVSSKISPDEYSLLAYSHIKNYLNGKAGLTKEEVNAVLRLSQHLRVFGLLSAIGYLNHARDTGRVQEKTAPVWGSLLSQMLNPGKVLDKRELMEMVQTMARDKPKEYMMEWSKSLVLSQQWNFWAKAHQSTE